MVISSEVAKVLAAAGQGVGDDFALGDLHSSRAARSAMKRVQDDTAIFEGDKASRAGISSYAI